MYGNMTREEMIQRLYEGNFTTGELERQLIAKLFEQCCGGGGSSGGEALIVHANAADDGSQNLILDKTAAEIFGAFQSSGVIVISEDVNGNQGYMTISRMSLTANGRYTFVVNNVNFEAYTGNDYPISGNK